MRIDNDDDDDDDVTGGADGVASDVFVLDQLRVRPRRPCTRANGLVPFSTTTTGHGWLTRLGRVLSAPQGLHGVARQL